MNSAVIDLNIKYSSFQEDLFFNTSERFRIITKGRRLGFTQGSAQYVIEFMLQGDKKVLWGDTTLLNIRNYYERYFKPILSKLPDEMWSWRVTDKQLYIGNSVCDFRSADNPENWEGFGYDLVILNEAGIILKNRYLWDNAVRPMLMDNPKSIAIIGGTPKGKGLFYELWAKGNNYLDNNYKSFKFSTYDNPFLTKQAIDEFVAEQPENSIKQEIYGEFVDNLSNELFSYSAVLKSLTDEPPENEGVEVWGVDVARQGSDQSVIAKRRGNHIYKLIADSSPDLEVYADKVEKEYSYASIKPMTIFVEINGVGGGLFDMLKKRKLPVVAADVAQKASTTAKSHNDKFTNMKLLNKRAEMYKAFADAVKKGLKLPDDKKLLGELSCIGYQFVKENTLKILSKDEIKKELGYSPDRADACALTFFSKPSDWSNAI